jgi:hypothetical protein
VAVVKLVAGVLPLAAPEVEEILLVLVPVGEVAAALEEVVAGLALIMAAHLPLQALELGVEVGAEMAHKGLAAREVTAVVQNILHCHPKTVMGEQVARVAPVVEPERVQDLVVPFLLWIAPP